VEHISAARCRTVAIFVVILECFAATIFCIASLPVFQLCMLSMLTDFLVYSCSKSEFWLNFPWNSGILHRKTHETLKAYFSEYAVGRTQSSGSVYLANWHLSASTCWREQLWPWEVGTCLLAYLAEKTYRPIMVEIWASVSHYNTDILFIRTAIQRNIF